jgi:hypothetical protein
VSPAYEARRERLSRLLAASLMGLTRDPVGDRLPPECWRAMLKRADAILFVVSPPLSSDHAQAGAQVAAEVGGAL